MKYTYKQTNKYAQTGGSGRWKTWATVVVTAVLFIFCVSLSFPNYVEKTGLTLPEAWKEPFRLGLDLQGGTHLVYEASMSEIPNGEEVDALNGVKDVIERRVNAFGVSEPIVQTTIAGNSYRVIIELAGVLDVNEAIKLIGETPILEFKVPSNETGHELTEEELAELEAVQNEERAAAEDVLTRAQNGEDFNALVNEFSTDTYSMEEDGMITITVDHTRYGKLAQAIIDNRTREGKIVPELIETFDGLNVLKYISNQPSVNADVSHILVCYEGTYGCQSDRSEIDASILINEIKEQATADNFADLARENSDDPGTAGSGGALGWVSPGDMVAAFEAAYMSTEPGQISDVVQTEYGYHLILVNETEQATSYTFARVLLPYTTETDMFPPSNAWDNTELSGRNLTRANTEFDPTTGQPYVALSFDGDGDKLFGQITEAHVGEQIAIFLDGEVISAPYVQEAIYGGQAIIQGNFTIDEAKLLAQRLNAGALPVPLELLSQQTVGPTLGQISLEKSIQAALIGFLLVGLFMILYYRLAGLLAFGALVMYAAFNLAVYKLLGVTITLAGIAGFILSLGMAVDANVLIFERFREELKAGRDVLGAIDEGFRRAWSSIRDGNLTTLIAAAILFWFSTSFIKGFALTLGVGILLSMFTAITVTRVWLRLIGVWRVAKPLWLYGVKRKKD